MPPGWPGSPATAMPGVGVTQGGVLPDLGTRPALPVNPITGNPILGLGAHPASPPALQSTMAPWDVVPPVLVVGDHMCLGGPDKVEIIRTLE